MPINESSDNVMYQTYGHAGRTPALIVPALLLNAVTIPGCFMNTFVVLVTLFTKNLHGTANYLLALISVGEVLHQSGHCVFLFVALSGINFITILDAVHLMTVMLFGVNVAMFGMLSAAFDRLLAIVSQKIHDRLNKPMYLSVYTLLCAAFGVYGCTYIYEFGAENADAPTTGCVTELLGGVQFFCSTTILNALSAICYLAVWLSVRMKSGVTKETNARLLKSLVIILSVNIGGYFINLSIYQLLFSLAHFNPVLIFHIGFVSGIALNIGAASNALILYTNSLEYRKAFRNQMQKTSKFWHSADMRQQKTVVGVAVTTHSHVGKTTQVQPANNSIRASQQRRTVTNNAGWMR